MKKPNAKPMGTTTGKRIVEDSKKDWVIRITKEHIKLATCKNPEKCVVAQAIQDALGPFARAGFEGVSVGPRITKVYLNGREIRFATPHALTSSIRGCSIARASGTSLSANTLYKRLLPVFNWVTCHHLRNVGNERSTSSMRTARGVTKCGSQLRAR